MPARAQQRRFGATMAIVFALLAALAWWRDAPRARSVFGLIALVFALGALFVPAWLRPVERAWLRFGERLGAYVTTPILFTLFWIVGFVPIGVLRRTFGRSPLKRDPTATTYWHTRVVKSPDVARSDLERQF